MAPVARLWRPAVSPDSGEARVEDGKPEVGAEYLDWLDRVWRGDTRELREGRFLHQQGDLRQAFAASPYWREVARRLYDWSTDYRTETDALLFQGAPAVPKLANKPWQSFLSRTWRENVHRNDNWPDPPPGGWWLPDNWFERAWDIVRTRFVVRYMDGVKTLAENLVACAEERRFKLDAHVDAEAKADGYYAYHVLVRQPFAVPALDYGGNQERTSYIEIQVMTELAEVVSQLTHPLYETRREAQPAEMPALWKEDSDEHEIIALGQQSAKLERDVLRIRKQNRAMNGNGRRRSRRRGK
jgi:ppGpp synthetase/RelA/SpoT-type nucleotidyltranferase